MRLCLYILIIFSSALALSFKLKQDHNYNLFGFSLSCKKCLSVVYFDLQMGALHAVCWSKLFVSEKKTSFLVFFHSLTVVYCCACTCVRMVENNGKHVLLAAKNDLSSKKLSQPANSMRSTRLLGEIHNIHNIQENLFIRHAIKLPPLVKECHVRSFHKKNIFAKKTYFMCKIVFQDF